MSYLNEVQLLGNLGDHPHILKQDEHGAFVRLSIATAKKYKTPEGKVEQTEPEWHSVFLNNSHGKNAAALLKKGDKVLVLGELKTNQWTDPTTGQEKASAVVYAREWRLIYPHKKQD